MDDPGLTIVYTGKGKGKTTAALGIALRASGYDKKICMIQFIKGSWHYGEMNSSKRLEPEFEMVAVGKPARQFPVYRRCVCLQTRGRRPDAHVRR